MKLRRAAITGLLAAIGMLAAAFTAEASAVRVEQGWLSGSERNAVTRYLGIPYARPPVGALRWRAPRPPVAWEGIYQAMDFGSACPQLGNFYVSNDPETFGRPYGSEDCLYLNIWAPTVQNRARPVLFFIHGGAGIYGAASLPLYDGQRLAEGLDAVVVSINYRLGVFGGMQLPALHSGDPVSDTGLFGLLDQIQALNWVQQNIRSFGGDPANVTVMGHSAGCVSIWSLMRSPLASGRFSKSVCLSGLPLYGRQEELVSRGEEFLGRLLEADGLIAGQEALPAYQDTQSPRQIRDYLYAKPAADIIEQTRGMRGAPGAVDAVVLTAGEGEPLVNPVPSIIGNVRDESNLLLLGRAGGSAGFRRIWSLIHGEQKDLRVSDILGGPFSRLKFSIATWLGNKSLPSKVDRSAALLAVQSVPVYRYEFLWDNIPEPWRSAFGVYHGLDIPFIFGTFEREAPNFTYFTWAESEDAELEAIHQQFVAGLKGFIESGEPDKYSTQLQWPEWAATHTRQRIP